MKKVTAIIMAADIALSFGCCGVQRRAQKVDVEPIREVVSEEISAYMEDVKETNEKISSKVKESFDCDKITTKTGNDNLASPYLRKNLGRYKLTFYVPDAKWGYATATGETPRHLQTCAVDPSVIPYGSTLLVVGQNGQQLVLRANDCGNGIKGQRLDIFWDKSISEGYDFFASFGEEATVYLLEE